MDHSQKNRFTLYNKNNKILDFHCERKNGMPVFSVDRQYSDKVPFGFWDIGRWIENRRAPKHRKHIREILEKCGCNDLEGYVRFTFCAGLHDTFWVKPEDQDLTWDKVSLYQNEFDQNIAHMAFDGGLMEESFSSTTPELATDGTFPKCWKREEDEIYLYKQGSSGARNAGREPYSEMYAYELAKHLCDKAVAYDVVKYHGKIATKCRLFTNETVSYAPMAYVINPTQASFGDILQYFDSIGAGEQFRQMIVLDALLVNTDRHLKNFGILYQADTMDVIGMSPVFDHNLSLCPYAEIEELQNLEQYLPTRPCAFGEGFHELALRCMTDGIKANLRNLRGFAFEEGHAYHLPPERVALLSQMVNYQLDNLLQQRVLSMHREEEHWVRLDNFCITIPVEQISTESRTLLMKENFFLSDFSLTTKSGDTLFVRNAHYMVNEYQKTGSEQTYIQIEVINAEVEGTTSDLEVRKAGDLYVYDKACKKMEQIPVATVEVQISRGNDSETSMLEGCGVFVVTEERFKKEIFPAMEANRKSVEGSINIHDTVPLRVRMAGIQPIRNPLPDSRQERFREKQK